MDLKEYNTCFRRIKEKSHQIFLFDKTYLCSRWYWRCPRQIKARSDVHNSSFSLHEAVFSSKLAVYK